MRHILAVLLWLLPLSAQAAITCTGTSFPFNTPTDPQAQDYTVPSVTNGITIVHAAVRNGARSVNAITIGGNAMTQIGSRTASTDTVTEVYYRLAVSSGTNSISVGWDATPLSYVLTAVTCDNVNQSSPIAVNNSATGSSTTVSVDCAGTTSGQVVLDFVSADGNTSLTTGANQTNIDQDVADATLAAGVSSEPGGGTITMSHTITSNDWATICAALAEAPSGRTKGSAGYLP